MKVFLLICLAICAASADRSDKDKEEIFNDYLNKYNIRSSRSGADLEHKKKNFFENLDKVDKHNEKFKNGEATYELAINEFSALNYDEFVSLKTGVIPPQGNETWGGETAPELNRRGRASPPATWDWRNTYGVVRPVQNQGSCGSCWAFAASGAIEGQMALRKQSYAKVSEQEVIECAKNPWTGALLGCRGGWDFATYNHATSYRGITSSASKPYRAVDYLGCYTGYTRAAYSNVKSYVKLQNNAAVIKDYLFNVGPLYVTYYVSNDFYSYRGGVYTDNYRYCTTQYANHAVLLVGYGTQNGVDYWLLKNSWGTGWGENGYFKLARGRNLCQVEASASYPVLV